MKDLQSYLDEALKHVKLTNVDDEPCEVYDIHEEIRELIINTRCFLDITQNQLAEKLGISQSDICKIESGDIQPDIATLKKIADALGKRLIVDFDEVDDFM